MAASTAHSGALVKPGRIAGRRGERGGCHRARTSVVVRAESSCGRRDALAAGACVLATVPGLASTAEATPLAPLGKVGASVGGEKRGGMGAEAVAKVLERDLREGQYFVTGALTPEIFEDECRFKDPTNDIVGLSRYIKALGLLFDPLYSGVELKGIKVTSPDTIEADWRLGGFLNKKYFPWGAKIDPLEGHTVYKLSDRGLVALQEQTWSITGFEALQQTFTPAGVAPYKVL
ncbi:unnamed protein product [Pedinophyceae sp. YPF-701]|nr:unnamed protein product [Pedinophyceae sp. YPF-701]